MKSWQNIEHHLIVFMHQLAMAAKNYLDNMIGQQYRYEYIRFNWIRLNILANVYEVNIEHLPVCSLK